MFTLEIQEKQQERGLIFDFLECPSFNKKYNCNIEYFEVKGRPKKYSFLFGCRRFCFFCQSSSEQ